MTTEQKFIEMLEAHGMFKSQAQKVMEVAKPKLDSIVKDYKFTWNRPASEYPEMMYNVFFQMNIKPIALAWIDENIPLAWYRPMFVNEKVTAE